MNPELIFSVANNLAVVGWLLLLLFPRRRWSAPLTSGLVIPSLLGIAYTALVLTHWGKTPGGFSSLAAVSQLFQSPWMLLAGWIHYLAFDLFIGSWEVRDSRQRGISHWFVIPCLLLTFFFGPIGLVAYLGLRFITVPKDALRTLAFDSPVAGQ